jgi:diguanylate cyclase (GGDEF)-like protein
MPSAAPNTLPFRREAMGNTSHLHDESPDAGPTGADPTPATAGPVRPDPEAAAMRRRALLLAAALAVPTLIVLAGAPSAWPLLVLPLAVAGPLCGSRGVVAAAAVAAVVTALASGTEAAPADDMALGLAAFVATGLVVAAGHRALERRLERAERLGATDRLTGLHNYAYLEDALDREVRRAQRYGSPLSLVLLDLDRFKEFNDRHGHEAGNRLLAAVGGTIAAGIRGSDVGARFGGEEFAVLIPGDLDEAAEAAERLRVCLGELEVRVGPGRHAGTTASAGVAEFGRGEAPEDLVRRADGALYASKHGGRDRLTVAAPARPTIAA